MKRWAVVFVCLMAITSCEIKENNSVRRIAPDVRSNSPVAFGEELKVFTLNSTEEHYYEMTFPDGRSGSLSDYTSAEARFSEEGLYIVSSYDDEGFIGKDSVFVDILPEPVSCTPDINKLTSPTAGVGMSFTFVGSRSEGGDQRRVYANSSSGDFDMVFGHPEDPAKESTYICRQQSSFNTADEVSVSMNLGGTLYGGTPGQYVNVSVENDKTYFTLCDFEMSRGNTKFIISTRLELD